MKSVSPPSRARPPRYLRTHNGGNYLLTCGNRPVMPQGMLMTQYLALVPQTDSAALSRVGAPPPPRSSDWICSVGERTYPVIKEPSKYLRRSKHTNRQSAAILGL